MPEASSAINAGCGRFRTKRHLVIAVGRDLDEVVVPGLARVDAQLLGRLALQQIPGAFDVGGGERLAVMPFDALAQMEGQLGAVLVPGPVGGEFGTDRLRGCSAATCWSKMTRLLNTAIIGRSATTVDSSWIDMLAGLSIWYSRRMPPDFCADGRCRIAATQPGDRRHDAQRFSPSSPPDAGACRGFAPSRLQCPCRTIDQHERSCVIPPQRRMPRWSICA